MLYQKEAIKKENEKDTARAGIAGCGGTLEENAQSVLETAKTTSMHSRERPKAGKVEKEKGTREEKAKDTKEVVIIKTVTHPGESHW